MMAKYLIIIQRLKKKQVEMNINSERKYMVRKKSQILKSVLKIKKKGNK